MEEFNLKCKTSEEFLQAVGDMMIEYAESKEIDIWSLSKAISKKLNKEEGKAEKGAASRSVCRHASTLVGRATRPGFWRCENRRRD